MINKTLSKILMIVFLLKLSIILSMPFITAHQESISPGITPDSPLYSLDIALEKLQLLLARDNIKKAELSLKFATERIAEVKAMAEKNNLDAAEKAVREHSKLKQEVKLKIKQVKEDREEVKNLIKIEKELFEQESLINSVLTDIESFLGKNLSSSESSVLDNILTSLSNSTAEVEIEIKQKKDKIKIKIEQEGGEDKKEIEKEFKELEKSEGLLELKIERASEKISDAEEKILEVEEKLNQIANNKTSQSIQILLQQAKEKLSNAKSALANNSYGEAFGYATASEMLARNAKKIIEQGKAGQLEEELEEKEIKVKKNKSELEIEEKEERIRKVEEGKVKIEEGKGWEVKKSDSNNPNDHKRGKSNKEEASQNEEEEG